MISRILNKSVPKSTIARAFSKLNSGDTPFYERPASDRVVSTPEWPAPYYQRKWRSYPVRDTNKDDLSGVLKPFDEITTYHAKREIGKTIQGRDTIAHIENHIALDSKFLFRFFEDFWILFVTKLTSYRHETRRHRKDGSSLRWRFGRLHRCR